MRAMEAPASETRDEPMTDASSEVFIPLPEQLPTVVSQLLTFGASLETMRRRKGPRRPADAATTSDQLALF